MKFIDTHSHIYSKEFDHDRKIVVEQAIESGVNKILLPNISSKHTNKMLSLCKEFPSNCFPMMGLHPCDVKKETYNSEIEHVEEELNKNSYIGVGEIGIDLYWDKSNLSIQKDAFIKQIKIAKKHKLPIVIHVRESFEETIKIVEELNDKNLSGVFHCFTGNLQDAERIIKLDDFYLGIGGVLTFKNSHMDKVIEKINEKHLLLETDAPYLTPTPFRGKRNESKYILEIAKKLAEVKNLSLEEISKVTTINAKNLFKI